MDERLRDWRPTQEEIERILDEMRPIIHELARRDRETVRAAGCAHRLAARANLKH